MTHAWRLDKAKRTREESFSGTGAQLSGGRWNHKGIRAIYASESLALAALERFVHTQEEGSGIPLIAYKIEVPEPVEIDARQAKELPPNWRDEPPPHETKDLGTDWLRNGKSAVLRVPSVIVPTEHNFLINPVHPHFSRIKVVLETPFDFDPRMWK